jgi:hypothetical protein
MQRSWCRNIRKPSHIAGQDQTYKLVHGIDKVEWLKLLNHIPEGRTRLAADPLNMRVEQSKTDVRTKTLTLKEL